MTNNIYFYQMMNNTSYKSGKITLKIPPVEGDADGDESKYVEIVGLLEGDVSLSMGVEWGPILPDMENIANMGGLLGSKDIYSWIQSSAVFWKGCKPLEFKVDFYLITLDRSQDIKKDAKHLAQLVSMYTIDKTITGTIHGGYYVDYATNNGKLNVFTTSTSNGHTADTQLLSSLIGATNTATVIIGDQMVIRNLLLTNITLTSSSVQVDNGKPLFIKVEANFRSNRALISTDLDQIFGGSGSDRGEIGSPDPAVNNVDGTNGGGSW